MSLSYIILNLLLGKSWHLFNRLGKT